jgi:nitric oxide reductase subunit B
VLWIVLNFFPIGWAQLDAVFEHGLAYARSNAFYRTTLVWQWLRLPGDVLFALGALLMAWDFIRKFPRQEAHTQPWGTPVRSPPGSDAASAEGAAPEAGA